MDTVEEFDQPRLYSLCFLGIDPRKENQLPDYI